MHTALSVLLLAVIHRSWFRRDISTVSKVEFHNSSFSTENQRRVVKQVHKTLLATDTQVFLLKANKTKHLYGQCLEETGICCAQKYKSDHHYGKLVCLLFCEISNVVQLKKRRVSNTLAAQLEKRYLMENSKHLLNTMKSMRTKGGGAFSLRCNAQPKLFFYFRKIEA